MRYDYVTGVNNFANILRFDSTDILSNTNNVEYALVNRLYAKRVNPDDDNKDCAQPGMSSLTIGGAPPSQRGSVGEPHESGITALRLRSARSADLGSRPEILLRSHLRTRAGSGQRNVFTSTADFTGIAFLNDMRRFSPIISRLRVETSPRTNTEWDLDYDLKTGRINGQHGARELSLRARSPSAAATHFCGSTTCSRATRQAQRDFHQFRLLFGYRPAPETRLQRRQQLRL